MIVYNIIVMANQTNTSFELSILCMNLYDRFSVYRQLLFYSNMELISQQGIDKGTQLCMLLLGQIMIRRIR